MALQANVARTAFAPGVVRTADGRWDPGGNAEHKGLHVIIDVTVNAGGLAAVTFKIVGIDPASGKDYTILSSAALSAVATTVLRVYPGLTAAANLTANDFLPYQWALVADHADANPITYSVGVQMEK